MPQIKIDIETNVHFCRGEGGARQQSAMEWVKKGLARNGKAGDVEDGSPAERARLGAPAGAGDAGAGGDGGSGGDGGAGEPALETEQERRERWRSVYIIYFTMFQMSLGFSIVLTGVWPYLDKVLIPNRRPNYLYLHSHRLSIALFTYTKAQNLTAPLIFSV